MTQSLNLKPGAPVLTQNGPILILTVKVVPNSSRTQITGTLGQPPTHLKIKVAQPPEDNRANRAVIALLAETLGIAPSQISLISGHTHPRKTLQLQGITLADAAAALLPFTPPPLNSPHE